MEALQDLLNQVIKKTDALKTAQTLYSRQLAPKFNTLDYISSNELGLSQILADLLNPKGSHGQEKDFLRLFIDHCLPSIAKTSEWQNFLNSLNKTKVFVEEITWKSGTRRRMDIYLECEADGKSYGICIENKPYASDQFEQLKDYATELRNRRLTHWHLIYLNEHGNTPSEHSIKADELDAYTEEKKFSALKFSNLIDWLKACQVECQNHSVTEFLAQLIKFIQKQFMGIEDMNESKSVLEVMQKSRQNIEASIQISNNVEAMKKQLIQKLIQDIKNKFSENYDKKPYKLDVKFIGEGKNYEQINFIIPDYDIGYICFEFQGANFDRPCLGVEFISAKAVKNCLHADRMKTVLNEELTDKKVSSSASWPAYYYFQPQDWKTSSEAWLMIRNDQMAAKILQELDMVFSILNDNGCFNL